MLLFIILKTQNSSVKFNTMGFSKNYITSLLWTIAHPQVIMLQSVYINDTEECMRLL